MISCGKVIDNCSRCFAIPLAVVLCLGALYAPKARAQSVVSVNVVTTTATPLNPGFNGFNSNMLNAVEYYDTNLQHTLTALSPGWLRFPGGTDSEAFDWASGEIVSAWVDALAAKKYQHDINAAAQPIVAGKGGASFSDFANMATNVGGAKIIVSVNAFTDTPQSAQAFAQYALTNHIPVAAWELANEPYTWLKTDAGQPGFFTDATDYANKMKPYRDAIKAVDPNAVVALYFSEAGHPDAAWDNALASYSPKYWDAVTYHEYVFPGNLTTFSDLMAAANGNLFSNTTSHVTDYLMPKNNSGVPYLISEVSPAAGQGGVLLGTLYGGIYSAEFALRMSTLPQVKYVASFQMLSNAGIDETNHNLKVVENAYNSGTTTNTSGLNFGFFLSAQAAGEAVANVALHNSIGVYTTTTAGGPTAPTDGGGSIPAVYAQAYQGGNGKRYIVLTNKGATTAAAEIMQDGVALTNPMLMTFVTGTDPSLVNAGMAPDPVQIQTQTVTIPGAVTIPPYSVARLEWGVSTAQSPTISLSVTQLSYWDYTAQSSLTPPQAIGVSNTGGGTLSFTATPSAPWINVATTASGFTVSVNPAGLAVGPHSGTISVTAPGATNSPQTVSVTLTISASAQIPPASAARFVPITPCRIADTRNATGPFGGPSLPRQTSRDFAVPASACGIPSAAVAYSMNVAVVPSGALGFLTLWPTGQPQPLVATLNSDGRIKSNAAIVPAGANGAISVFVTDATDVILDINGYFVPASNASALAFYPVTPCRVADTRNPTAPLGGPSLAAQGTRSFPIQASSCGLPASAQAYSLNFAAVPKGPTLGFMTAWPAGRSQPVVASLNDPTGTVLSNAVVVPGGTGGAVNVYTTDATDLVIDINGYFAPPGAGGLSLYTVAPCRVIDTRMPAGSPPFSTTKTVNVTAAPCGVPVAAQALVFNATVVPPGFLGYITMWPQGQTQPLAAALNAYDGAVTNNMAIVPTNNGSISVFPSAPTHLVLDIFGYFAP
jgi:hypothetical protein